MSHLLSISPYTQVICMRRVISLSVLKETHGLILSLAGGLFFKPWAWRLFKVLLPSLMKIQLTIILLACHPKEPIITCERWHELSSYMLMFAVSKEKSFLLLSEGISEFV